MFGKTSIEWNYNRKSKQTAATNPSIGAFIPLLHYKCMSFDIGATAHLKIKNNALYNNEIYYVAYNTKVRYVL